MKNQNENQNPIQNFIGKKCIVRTYSAGVWFGDVSYIENTISIVKNARRIWYWDGAASLAQLAKSGTTKPNKCKFTETITDECGIYLPQTIEIIPCTEESVNSINSVDIWKV
jgi:hypothetical protein